MRYVLISFMLLLTFPVLAMRSECSIYCVFSQKLGDVVWIGLVVMKDGSENVGANSRVDSIDCDGVREPNSFLEFWACDTSSGATSRRFQLPVFISRYDPKPDFSTLSRIYVHSHNQDAAGEYLIYSDWSGLNLVVVSSLPGNAATSRKLMPISEIDGPAVVSCDIELPPDGKLIVSFRYQFPGTQAAAKQIVFADKFKLELQDSQKED